MTGDQIALARYALGLCSERRVSFRNRFTAVFDSAARDEWNKLVADGMAEQMGRQYGEWVDFRLTQSGIAAALLPGEVVHHEHSGGQPATPPVRQEAREEG